MKNIETLPIADDFGEQLDALRIQEQFFPWPEFKVARRTYGAGDKFDLSQRLCKLLVFSGRLEFRNSDHELRIGEGEWAEVPSGCYRVEVRAECDANVVYVWDIEAASDEVESQANRTW